MEDKKLPKKAKNIFTSLKTDPKSVLFLEEIINNRLLKKFKNPSIKETPCFLSLFSLPAITLVRKKKMQTRVDYVEKRKIDRWTFWLMDLMDLFSYFMPMLEI